MPNHVTTHLLFDNQTDFENAKNTLINSDGAIDFNRVVPMPESLKTGVSPTTKKIVQDMAQHANQSSVDVEKRYRNALKNMKDDNLTRYLYDVDNYVTLFDDELSNPTSRNHTLNDEVIDQLEIHVSNLETHGYATWYGWSIDNWGVKWNGYNVGEFEAVSPLSTTHILVFDTPWVAPFPLLGALAKRLDIAFNLVWLDENAYDGLPEEDLTIDFLDPNVAGLARIENGIINEKPITKAVAKELNDIIAP